MKDEFATKNLRPYRTLTDLEELDPDEILVDELLKKRTVRGQVQYYVKWRQYPVSAATWETRTELLRRCRTLVEEFDEQNSTRRQARAAPAPAAAPSPSPTMPDIPEADENNEPRTTTPAPPPSPESETLPSVAAIRRGRWLYGRRIATPRGMSLRMCEAKIYTPSELKSAYFVQLRTAALEELKKTDIEAYEAFVSLNETA